MIEKLSLSCDELLSHRQLACCPSYCGLPLHSKDITIYSHVDTELQPLLLTGHHSEVTAMTFGKGSRPVLLCSASADYIIVWDVELCQRRSQEGQVAAGTVIGSLLGEIVHLSFCFADERVAACSGTTVYILSSKSNEVIAALNGHLGPVTSAEFCPWDEEVIVTTSQDRTFKVWDFKTEAVRYQSYVLSASPLLGVLFMEESRQLVTGATDGQVWCFSFPVDYKCHLVTKMDLQKMEKRHETHRGAGSQQPGVTDQSSVSEVEVSKSVLKMASCSSMSGPRGNLTMDNSWLFIGSYDGLYVVDLATSELLTVLYFKDFPNLSLKMAGSWSISPGWEDSMVFLVSAMFTPCAVLLELRLCDLEQIWSCSEGFSVFPSSPLLPDSPLNADFTRKQTNHPKKKGMKEHSLVFHSKVKSSGYTSAPRRIMFSPKTNNQKNPSSKKSPQDTGLCLRDYPADTAAPTIQRIHLSTGSKPVYCFQYSGDGKQILCGLGDSSVLLYKSSLSGNPAVYTGHNKPVNSVSWSLNRQDWLSASEDQSLRIWTRGSPKPAIIMNNFSKPIRSAQFYYLDKFLLLASGASLCLYLYDVDTTHDDIKRYQQRSAVKLARRFETSAATDITAMSAISDFFSYVVLVCGSDRSVQVLDMNRGSVASVLPDAHSRAVHCITQNKGSMFSTQAPDSYNLFLTSAVTDGMKIWDLRTLGCVRRYENHVNRCHPCESAISPCGRFIASGSEDNCAYVYDIRSSSFLHKLPKHSDTVLRVAFNPATPELLTGTLDGRLRLFQSSSGAQLSHDTSAAVHRVPNTTT